MRRRMKISAAAVLVLAAAVPAFGTTIFWSFLVETGQLADRSGVVLTAGDPAVTDDGTLLELLAWVGDDIAAQAERIAGPEKGYDPAAPERGEDHPNYELLAVARVGDGMDGFTADQAAGRFNVRSDPDADGLEDRPLIVRFWDRTMLWYNEVYNESNAAWQVPEPFLFSSIDLGQSGSAVVGDLLGRDGRSGDDLMATIPVIPEPGTLVLLGFAAWSLSNRAVRRRRHWAR